LGVGCDSTSVVFVLLLVLVFVVVVVLGGFVSVVVIDVVVIALIAELVVDVHEPLFAVVAPEAVVVAEFGAVAPLGHDGVGAPVPLKLVGLHLVVDRADEAARQLGVEENLEAVFLGPLGLGLEQLALVVVLLFVALHFLLALEHLLDDLLALEPRVAHVLAVLLCAQEFLELLGGVEQAELLVEAVFVGELVHAALDAVEFGHRAVHLVGLYERLDQGRVILALVEVRVDVRERLEVSLEFLVVHPAQRLPRLPYVLAHRQPARLFDFRTHAHLLQMDVEG